MQRSVKCTESIFRWPSELTQCKKPHTIAEELVLPAIMDMCKIMINEESAIKLKTISLSDSIIRRRIEAMATNVKEHLIEKPRSVERFPIQIDETTDITTDAQLLTFVR